MTIEQTLSFLLHGVVHVLHGVVHVLHGVVHSYTTYSIGTAMWEIYSIY